MSGFVRSESPASPPKLSGQSSSSNGKKSRIKDRCSTKEQVSKIRYIKIEALPLGKMPYRGSSVYSLFELYTLVRRVTYQLEKKNRPPSRRYTLVTYAISTLRKRCTLFGTQGNQTLFRLSADPTPTLQRSSRTFVINVQVQHLFRITQNA